VRFVFPISLNWEREKTLIFFPISLSLKIGKEKKSNRMRYEIFSRFPILGKRKKTELFPISRFFRTGKVRKTMTFPDLGKLGKGKNLDFFPDFPFPTA
jgi:hypothetical protein